MRDAPLAEHVRDKGGVRDGVRLSVVGPAMAKSAEAALVFAKMADSMPPIEDW